MPELPEVETTRRGIEPHLRNRKIVQIDIFQPKLRWPVPEELKQLEGQRVQSVARRGKYLLLNSKLGTAILHLGMSGSLRVVPASTPLEKHDHLQFQLASGKVLRLRDPRRFGAALWSETPLEHPLLAKLGPEPLGDDFDLDHLANKAKGRKVAIKSLIMNSQIVVGVGNIYANEALFMSGIQPETPSGKLSKRRLERLVTAIKTVLAKAIEQGGTTLKDFQQADGKPGYFKQELQVYGREGEPCHNCQNPIQQQILGQRATYFCPHCQR